MTREELYLGRFHTAATSGRTGLRGLFLWGPAEWTTVLGPFARANEWAGIRVGLGPHLDVAIVSSLVPSHQSAIAGASLESSLVSTLRLDSTRPLAELVSS